MLQGSYTLQVYRILEPYDPPLIALQLIDKRPSDKSFNDTTTLLCHISGLPIHGNGRLRPDNKMGNTFSETIRPVIDQDLVIRGILKWD